MTTGILRRWLKWKWKDLKRLSKRKIRLTTGKILTPILIFVFGVVTANCNSSISGSIQPIWAFTFTEISLHTYSFHKCIFFSLKYIPAHFPLLIWWFELKILTNVWLVNSCDFWCVPELRLIKASYIEANTFGSACSNSFISFPMLTSPYNKMKWNSCLNALVEF